MNLGEQDARHRGISCVYPFRIGEHYKRCCVRTAATMKVVAGVTEFQAKTAALAVLPGATINEC
jgi:hypothetical protein